jgi:predicted nucleic acid-binding protein
LYLLDTDVISQITKPKPNEAAMRWLASESMAALHLSVATIVEIRIGIELMPGGRRKRAISQWLTEDLPQAYLERILPVGLEIAEMAGVIIAQSRAAGFAGEPMDALIAATAKVHGLKVATLNRKHFEKLGVELVEF